MIITATSETIETGELETTTVECQDYTFGFEQLRRMLPEGVRLLSVLPQR
ncbi:hypothetical protein [Arthrobacter sp. GMC3]|nr:hypothetical protein [Arthrobacter sp. GMC3]